MTGPRSRPGRGAKRGRPYGTEVSRRSLRVVGAALARRAASAATALIYGIGRGIAGLVVLDLEDEELVDRLDHRRVPGRDVDVGTGLRVDGLPGDRLEVRLHLRHSGRDLGVDEHGGVEVAFGEHLRDVTHVLLDGVAARGVLGVVGADLDDAARLRQEEVVGGLFVVEAHDVVAALVDGGVVVRGRAARGGLSGEGSGDSGGGGFRRFSLW